jgi:hypothetical protein
MLDSLPGIRMSGENNCALGTIHQMIDNIANNSHFLAQQRHPRGAFDAAWGHNLVPEGAFACVAQHMIETINPPLLHENLEPIQDDSDTIVGFKTIRFLQKNFNISDNDKVDYVKEHFPCSRVLVNIRSNTSEQALSYASKPFFRERLAHDGETALEERNDRLRLIAKLFGPQAMLLDSSDWVSNVDILNRVVQWLGFSESCYFQRLLEYNTKGYAHGEIEMVLNPNCRYVG